MPPLIRIVLQDPFIAGTDSSSATLEWALLELMKNPHAMEKAKAELAQVVGKKKAIKEAEHFGRDLTDPPACSPSVSKGRARFWTLWLLRPKGFTSDSEHMVNWSGPCYLGGSVGV